MKLRCTGLRKGPSREVAAKAAKDDLSFALRFSIVQPRPGGRPAAVPHHPHKPLAPLLMSLPWSQTGPFLPGPPPKSSIHFSF